MKFWKFLFGNNKEKTPKETPKETLKEIPKEIHKEVVPNKFREWVKQAIDLVGNGGIELSNEELEQHFVKNGIPIIESKEINIFLPISFCKKFLPEVGWPSAYIDYYSETKKLRRIYKQNTRYRIIEEETEKYWNGEKNKKTISNIVGRSAEFEAINKLVLEGGKYEDIELTEPYIIRN